MASAEDIEALEALMAERVGRTAPYLATPSVTDDAEDLERDPEADARFLQRKAARAALTRSRLTDMTDRLAALVPELAKRMDVTVDEDGQGSGGMERPMTVEQMHAKLAFVVEASADESRRGAADWAALLAAGHDDEQEEHRKEEVAGLAARLAACKTAHEAQTQFATTLIGPLRAVVSTFTTFYSSFLSRPASATGSSGALSGLRLACVLPLGAADVGAAAVALAQLVLAPGENSGEITNEITAAVRRAALDALVEALQPTLHGLFAAAFRREDAFLDDLAYLNRQDRPPSFFGVPTAYRLDGADQQQEAETTAVGVDDGGRARESSSLARRTALRSYEKTVYWLDSLSTAERSPSGKLERLGRARLEVDSAVVRYYRERGLEAPPTPLDAYVTGEVVLEVSLETDRRW